MVADQVVERGLVYNRGDTVFVDHHGVSGSVYDYAAERGTIYAEESPEPAPEARFRNILVEG